MMPEPDQRHRADRRRQPRGGRRPGDSSGFAPLVMLVGDEPAIATLAEAVLARLHFAVATIANVDRALHILTTLRADIVVAGSAEAQRIRSGSVEPRCVLELTDEMRQDPLVLVDAVRQLLRTSMLEPEGGAAAGG